MKNTQADLEICAIVSAVLGKSADLSTSKTSEPLWDSLKHMEIIFAVESKWGVTFSEVEMVSIQSVAQLLQRLREKSAA